MHTGPMSETQGDFGEDKRSDQPCPKCKKLTVTYRVWESSCGGYEDYKLTCNNPECKHTWWVEGPDS